MWYLPEFHQIDRKERSSFKGSGIPLDEWDGIWIQDYPEPKALLKHSVHDVKALRGQYLTKAS